MRHLANRGLRGVKLVIADAYLGLRAAVDKVLSATVQRCRVWLLKNLGSGHAQRRGGICRDSAIAGMNLAVRGAMVSPRDLCSQGGREQGPIGDEKRTCKLLQIDRRRRQIRLDLHVVQAAPGSASESVPGLRLAVISL